MIDRRKVSQAYQAMKRAKAAGTLGRVDIAAQYGLSPAEAAQVMRQVEFAARYGGKRSAKQGTKKSGRNRAYTLWDEEQALIRAAIAKFPAMFGLRAFPGKVFRLSEQASYVSDGVVLLYSQRRMPDGQWLDFAKGTIGEFEREIVPLRDKAGNRTRGRKRRVMSDAELEEHRMEHTSANSWWIKDVRGIEVARVCDECEESVKARYKPEVFGEGELSYEDVVEEPIEPDY